MNPVVLTAVLTLGSALCAKLAMRNARRTGHEFHKRGVRIADGRPMQRRSASRKKSMPELLTWAGVAIAPSDESKHFKLIGATGTGKTTAIRELLASAIARGDRAVFADPDAGYLSVSMIVIAAISFSIPSNRDPQSGICLRKLKTASMSINWRMDSSPIATTPRRASGAATPARCSRR